MTEDELIIVGPLSERSRANGRRTVTAWMITRLEAAGVSLRGIDTAGPSFGSLRRVATSLRAVVIAMWYCVTRPRATVYLVANDGIGRWRDLAILFVAGQSRARRIFVHHHTTRYFTCHDRAIAVMARLSRVEHLVQCASIGEYARTEYGIRATRVIGNAAWLPPLPCAPRGEGGRPTIGTLANLSVAKGARRFLKLADELACLDARWQLAGPMRHQAESEWIVAAARDLTARGKDVELVGQLDLEAREEFLDQLDVFVLLSESEAEPLAVLEAVRRGVAVVTTNVGCLDGLADAIPAGVHVVALSADSRQAARAVRAALCQANAREQVVAQYAAFHATAARQLEDFLDDVVSHRSHGWCS